MDNEAISADQARRLRQGLEQAGIGLGTFWMSYFRLGGDVNQLEVEAYLHHALDLPEMQRNILAQALTELTNGHRLDPVPFTWDYPIDTPDATMPWSFATVADPPAPADPPDPADSPADPPQIREHLGEDQDDDRP